MCGIIGVVAHTPVNQLLYDGLLLLQHRGQDAAGIVTSEGPMFHMYKGPGYVRDVFRTRNMRDLTGNEGIAHCRYPTAGSAFSELESQPFYVNSPFGITLAHNGNLTNSEALKRELFQLDFRHVNTNSDSEVLLNVLALELERAAQHHRLDPDAIFKAVAGVHRRCRGAYAVVAMIAGYGMVAFRDPFGIRPLIIGENAAMGGPEYVVASESVALEPLGFSVLRDVAPGEAIYVDQAGNFHARQCAERSSLNPCIFEYVYLARPDSVIDGTSVYESRLRMGAELAKKIRGIPDAQDVDVVIPIPDSSRPSALQLATDLGVTYREGFVKNRYIGRTFIMPGQAMRRKSVRQKLNPIGMEFKDKVVLLVDDSIVRGTTSREIVQMARDAGALSQRLRHRHAEPARAGGHRPHRGRGRHRDRRGPADLPGPGGAEERGAHRQSAPDELRGLVLRRQVHHRRHHQRLPEQPRRAPGRASRHRGPARGSEARARIRRAGRYLRPWGARPACAA
jgi:amidophosphoribosyltransferase